MERIILVDASGSMAEKGKGSAVKYLLYAVCSLLENECNITEYSVYIWNSNIGKYSGKIKFEGKADEDRLKDFLGQHEDSRLLVISDGCFSENTGMLLGNAGAMLLKVSSDQSIGRMGAVFGKRNVFDAADAAECTVRFANSGR